jgi:hypothetical protein
MLDFGTDMDSREEQEQNDDLFSGSTNAKSVEPNESPAVSAAVPEVKENKPPRRPILKPPVLPKYSEPQNNASAPAKTERSARKRLLGKITHAKALQSANAAFSSMETVCGRLSCCKAEQPKKACSSMRSRACGNRMAESTAHRMNARSPI